MVERYPGQDEILVNDFIKEYSERSYTPYPLYTIDSSTVVDDLYQESVNKVYTLVGSFLMYADTKVEDDTLTKYGIDRKRDIIFYLPRVIASSITFKGVPYVPILQDLIKFNGFYYQVLRIEEERWWAQTDRHLFYALFCDKLQENNRVTFKE